jgi:hypothetical protein
MSADATFPSPLDDSQHLLVGYKEGITLFSHSDLIVLMQLPLPGITIFVHGVNSDGEWFEQAEQGLCKGLKPASPAATRTFATKVRKPASCILPATCPS